MSDVADRVVGRYRVLRLLAEGGMGRVLLARTDGPAGFSKLVVLKTLHAHLAADQRFLELFLTEARISALLFHPNVAQVFELVEERGEYFLAMEYVRGRSARELVRARGGLPRAYALAIASQIVRALQHAHEAKDQQGRPLHVLHRDVSPENVMVTWDGGVKLLDFGLAGLTARRAGKEGYVAPEVVDGGHATTSSDQYAAGAVLAELLTGAVERQPDHPGDRALVQRALSASPSQRFPSAAAFADAIDELASTTGATATSASLAQLLRDAFGPPGDEEPAPPERRTAMLPEAAPSGPPPSSLRRRLAVAGAITLLLGGVMLAVRQDDPRPTPAEPASAPTVVAPVPTPDEAPAAPTTVSVAPAPAPVVPNAPEAPGRAPPQRRAPPAAPPAPSEPGQADIRAIPWANVSIDGKPVGVTPLPPQRLVAGPHTVALSNPELGVSVTRSIVVRAGQQERLVVDLLDELDRR